MSAFRLILFVLLGFLALPGRAQGLPETWPELLGRARGLLLLVEPQPGWGRLLREPAVEDLVSELAVENTTARDPALERFSIAGAGAYLFNEAGRLVGSWKSGPPSDVRAALAEVGWISRAEELERLIKDQGSRIDLHWRLVQEHWLYAQRRPVPENLDRLAGSLQRLLKLPGWPENRNRRLPFFAPPPSLKDPCMLRDLSRSRLEDLREILRQNPDSQTTWEMFAFLSAWHPGDEPRIHRFLENLSLPPGRHEELLDWPGSHAHRLAEEQLRRLKDWAGLEAFAQKRLDQILEIDLGFAPELPAVWTVRLGYQDSWGRLRPSRNPLTKQPFATESARAQGRWLLLLLEAQLALDKPAQASGTVSLLLRDATEHACREARSILRTARADALLKQLDAGMN